jgi:hypothetical protein
LPVALGWLVGERALRRRGTDEGADVFAVLDREGATGPAVHALVCGSCCRSERDIYDPREYENETHNE